MFLRCDNLMWIVLLFARHLYSSLRLCYSCPSLNLPHLVEDTVPLAGLSSFTEYLSSLPSFPLLIYFYLSLMNLLRFPLLLSFPPIQTFHSSLTPTFHSQRHLPLLYYLIAQPYWWLTCTPAPLALPANLPFSLHSASRSTVPSILRSFCRPSLLTPSPPAFCLFNIWNHRQLNSRWLKIIPPDR